MTIREFVKKSFEYDHYRKYGTWGKYTVYHVWNKSGKGRKSVFLILLLWMARISGLQILMKL